MSRSANGLFAVVLVVWTWAWVAFWKVLGWGLRCVWRRRDRIPHGHVALPAAAVVAFRAFSAGAQARLRDLRPGRQELRDYVELVASVTGRRAR